MTKENIGKFFREVMTNKALAEKVAALASENGYDFTAAELLELSAVQPLEDGDVEAVSGGFESRPRQPGEPGYLEELYEKLGWSPR